MFAKCDLRSVLAMFFVAAGLFFTANTAGAQVIQQSNVASQSGINWKSESDAIDAAKTQVGFYAQDLANFSPNQAGYKFNLSRVVFYKTVVELINSGFTVGNAVNSSLTSASTLGGQDTQVVLTRQELMAIYGEAVTPGPKSLVN